MSYESYDRGLEWLSPFGPDLAWGFTNHAPMVVEALCAMDRDAAVLPWLETHAKGLMPKPDPAPPVPADAWRDALGQPGRFAEWRALFDAELAESAWSDVLARWVRRLAPGLAAAAAHGVIRAGHAARGLAQGDTPLRRAELAAGLAYWAATWQTLPTSEAASRPPVPAREALQRVPRTVDTRPESMSIVGALQSLDDCPAFGGVIHDLDTDADTDTAGKDPVGELTELFARVFLANATDRLGAIVFTHGVTASASLRALLPWLDERTANDALRFAWQTGAALVATYARADPAEGEIDVAGLGRDALADAAIQNGDDHAIKLTEACLAEHARNPSPAFLAAARLGIERLKA